jgi:acyl carrier protein
VNAKPFLTDLAFELGLEPGQIALDAPVDTSEWDSLAMFSIIGHAQRHFNVVVDAKLLQGCKTVGDIVTLIESRREGA